MKYSSVLLLLLATLLFCGRAAHAEGNCPDGYYTIGGGSPGAPVGCAPIPGYDQGQQGQQQPAPPQWASKFGAIASYIPKGILGYSTNMASRSQAEQAAIADCKAQGGTECQIETWYSNGCAALIVGHPGYVVNTAPTTEQAVSVAMTACTNAGNTNCRVHYSACSLPQRI